MGLLDKLITQGSVLTAYDGKTPPKSSATVPLNPTTLVQSQLDLDGITPPKYLDNPPG
jgi:hypothetical protein